MKDTNCPYCGADVEITHDDGYGYEEDRLHEDYCSACNKHFAYTIYISFHYTAYKADCLNGDEHLFKKTITYPPQYAKLKCTACGLEKNFEKAEESA